MGYCLVNKSSSSEIILDQWEVFPCRPPARNTSRPRTGNQTGTSGAASKCQGALAITTRQLPPWSAPRCAARLPIENDILVVKDQTSDNNQVAQQFYDSPLWPKFRFWE